MADKLAHDGAALTRAAEVFAALRDPSLPAGDRMALCEELAEDASLLAAYESLNATWDELEPLETEPAVQREVKAALRAAEASPGGWRRRWAGLFAPAPAFALLAATMAFLLGYAFFFWPNSETQQEYATLRGEQTSVHASDGSTIYLNTLTRADVAIGRGSRRVRLLEGEAFFDVAHQKNAPFVIEAGLATVSVVGTRFEIDFRDGETEVTVAQGAVRIATAAKEVIARAGERVAVRPGGELVEEGLVDPDSVARWRQGVIEFVNAPFGEALDEIGRYGVQSARLGDACLANIEITAVFHMRDIDNIYAALAETYGLEVVADPQSGGLILRRPHAAEENDPCTDEAN